MDVLSDILKRIKLSSAVYFNSDFHGSWGMDIPEGPFAQFHMVTQGRCLLKVKNRTLKLSEGDIVVFPKGSGHWLADQAASRRESGLKVVQAIMGGSSIFEGNRISTGLVCGHFEFDRSFDHYFIKELPQTIYINEDDKKRFAWLKGITELIIMETKKERFGSTAIINKLGEILFIHVLRAYIGQNDLQKGFAASLKDHRIGKVLKAVHLSPGTEWQLATLAQVAGMSRTGFSTRFKNLIGDTPMNYITQWRVLRAKELLIDSSKPVREIALDVGYRSEAAFNRVFKKRVTSTPLKFRQANT